MGCSDWQDLAEAECQLAAFGPAGHKIAADKHRQTSIFEKAKYSTISRCKDAVCVSVPFFFFPLMG